MARLGLIASLFGGGCKPAAPVSATPPEAEAMKGLRTMMLTTSASKAGIRPNEVFPKVFGVVMDLPVSGGHTASVVSMCDGHASLYTTSTFGVLGGIGHESVRSASTNFVKAAQSHYDAATPATEYPYPAPDRVRFYLLGFDGVRVIDAELRAVEEGADNHSDMWAAGQQVLTELRLISEQEAPGNMRQTPRQLVRPGFVLALVFIFGFIFIGQILLEMPGRSRKPTLPRIFVNLQQINVAKQMWASDHGATNGAVVSEQDLMQYLKPRPGSSGLAGSVASEVYIPNAIGTLPEAKLEKPLGRRFPKGTLVRWSTNAGCEILLPNSQGGTNGWSRYTP